jgi:hypothetical protein
VAIKLSEFNHFKQQFNQKKFCRLPRIIPPHALALMFQASVLNRHHEGYMEYDDKTKAFGRYCDAMGEALLMMIHPMLEKRIGISLLPCYSFLRFYTPESRLPRHIDRPSCEISATLPIGSYQSEPANWPIWVESEGNDLPVNLQLGEILAYRGAEVTHWREPLQKGIWLQLFLHYVDADGDYTDYAFDQRERLGPVSLPVKERAGINLPKRK